MPPRFALSVANQDDGAFEVDVLVTQAKGFHEAQAAAIHEARDQGVLTVQRRNDTADFRARQNDRKPLGTASAYHRIEPWQFHI
jgi:hypothetical protein